VSLAQDWLDRLRGELPGYARLAMENIAREFPSYVSAVMTAPGDFPHRPRERTPVFYGSYDWHSCVEMHWLLVRLLKAAPDAVPTEQIRGTLDAQFTAEGLRQEAEFMRTEHGARMERPYGWGWALDIQGTALRALACRRRPARTRRCLHRRGAALVSRRRGLPRRLGAVRA